MTICRGPARRGVYSAAGAALEPLAVSDAFWARRREPVAVSGAFRARPAPRRTQDAWAENELTWNFSLFPPVLETSNP